ncbi:MAG: hypothetical protein ABH860_06080 [bacterium]
MRKASFIIVLSAFIVLQACMFAYGANPLSLSYAGGTGKGESTSQFDENNWTYKYQYHVLVLSGDVPQGSLFSQIQFEEMDYKTGLSYARMNLYGSTYSIDMGDNVVNFSDLTLNSLRYQGASVTLKPSSNFNLSVIGGTRGNGMWGADIRRDTRAKDNFTGVRTVFYPTEGMGLSATYLTTPGGADVLAYGGDYTFKDLKFAAEYGSALEGKAFSGEIKYQANFLTLGTIYRDIDPTYVVPFDYVTHKGKKGTYSFLGIRPSKNVSINIQSDSYFDRLNSTSDISNLDTRGDISCNFGSGTSVGFSGWRNDRQAYDRGGITEGEMMYITQQFYLLTRNSIYFRNQPTWFTSFSPSEESYSESKNVAGLNIALFDAVHLNYEIENAEKIFKNTDIKINPSAISSRMDLFESQIMDSPFYIASSINYRQDITDKDATEEATPTSMYSDATLKYIPGPDLNCYITVKTFNMDSPDADRTAREQNDISFGLNYTFNTNFYLK